MRFDFNRDSKNLLLKGKSIDFLRNSYENFRNKLLLISQWWLAGSVLGFCAFIQTVLRFILLFRLKFVSVLHAVIYCISHPRLQMVEQPHLCLLIKPKILAPCMQRQILTFIPITSQGGSLSGEEDPIKSGLPKLPKIRQSVIYRPDAVSSFDMMEWL